MLRKKAICEVFFYLLFSIIYTDCFCQDSANTIGRVTISSPNAASLGKYGDIPINYHTGIPNISIPIYTIKAGSLTLPIGLSYHASGLRVEEQASWVGAGWCLNAGGMITRTVRGAADDRGYANGYVTKGYYSDSGYYNYLFTNNVNGGLNSTAHTYPLGVDDEQFVANRKDGEPDIYTFNFGGYSGKFYFNDDQSTVMVPEADFKIQPELSSTYGFLGFIITASDGNKYYFGKTGNNGAVDPVENTFFITTQNTYGLSGRVASSWFLNKIIAANGVDSILLNYEQESYSYYNLSMFPVYYNSSVQFVGTWNAYTYEYDLAKNFIQGVRLSSITFPNGTVAFTPSSSARSDLANYNTQNMSDTANSNAKALASIQISDSSFFCKKFKFYTNYFRDSINSLNGDLFQVNYPTLLNIHTDEYCLRLDSLQELSCDSSIKIPPYKFSYFSGTVPRKLSFGIDHWGFNNGVTNNTTLLPSSSMTTASTFVQWAGANRDASFPAMERGSLEKITYPTGGYTKFEFEANTTYTSYTESVPTNVFSMSVGYDGSPTNPHTTTFTTSSASNLYKLVLHSDQLSGSGGNFEMLVGGTVIHNVHVNSGETVETFIVLSPSTTYNIEFYNSYIQSGHGINATIYEIIPTSYSGNATVGGLRIKSITNKDSVANNANVTSYSYNVSNNPAGQSSGILYSRPVYIQMIRNDVFGIIFGPAGLSNGCPTNSTGQGFFRSPSSIRPMETTQGNHIGYNEVYVSQQGNGYSVYRYYGSNVWDTIVSGVATTTFTNNGCNSAVPSYPSPPEQFDAMRGELKYEGHYNQNGQVLKDVWYFPEYSQNPMPTPGHIAVQNQVMGSYVDYSLYTYRKIRDRKVVTEYVPATGNYITDTSAIYYGSNYHHQATRTVDKTSIGDSIITTLKYAFDFRAACDTITDSLSTYLSAVTTANSTFYTYGDTCVPNNSVSPVNNCRWGAYINLRYDIAVARIKYMKFLKRNYSNSNSVFNTCHANAKSAAGSELKPILELQDLYKNPVIEKAQYRNANLLHADFTRYDYVSNPSGKVFPNKTQLINLAVTSGSFTNATVSGTSITKDSRYKDESIYLFDYGNPIQVVGHDSLKKSFIWDYKNTLPIAQVTNAANNQIAYTSFEADGKGNWTFSGTPINDYSAPTGRKGYLLSNGNITKSGLNSSGNYIVSYWSKNGQQSVSNSGTVVTGRSVAGWTYYEHPVSNPSGGTITVSGSGVIDELREYPKGALMSTYTYQPLLGMASQSDVNNLITYYEYDKLGRLFVVKDQNNYVVKKICYNYSGQTANCSSGYFSNARDTANYTKNNCGSGYDGSTVTYIVPAGTYISPISQGYVDSLAQAEVLANGQSYANTNGSCTCNTTTCSALGLDHKCVYGYCETGTKTCISSTFNRTTGLWTCTYVYYFSDCSSSSSFNETHSSSCTTGFCH